MAKAHVTLRGPEPQVQQLSVAPAEASVPASVQAVPASVPASVKTEPVEASVQVPIPRVPAALLPAPPPRKALQPSRSIAGARSIIGMMSGMMPGMMSGMMPGMVSGAVKHSMNPLYVGTDTEDRGVEGAADNANPMFGEQRLHLQQQGPAPGYAEAQWVKEGQVFQVRDECPPVPVPATLPVATPALSEEGGAQDLLSEEGDAQDLLSEEGGAQDLLSEEGDAQGMLALSDADMLSDGECLPLDGDFQDIARDLLSNDDDLMIPDEHAGHAAAFANLILLPAAVQPAAAQPASSGLSGLGGPKATYIFTLLEKARGQLADITHLLMEMQLNGE